MLTYDASPFDVRDTAAAKKIILTPTAEGRDTETRWQIETDYLVDIIGHCCKLRPGHLVLDYGCGIGRLAKPIIERFGARVSGVDISGHMRSLANEYVDDQHSFITLSPEALDCVLREELMQFDAAISVWTLQHAKDLHAEIDRLEAALRPNGRLFIVNERRRCVPTRELGWIDDGVNIRKLLASKFNCVVEGLLLPDKVGTGLSESAFWGVYEKRA